MPHWRAFPAPVRYGRPLAYRFLPWLARLNGALPGRRIGFVGTDAAGVTRDWARTALSGRYDVRGWPVDMERLLGELDAPLTAITLTDDWFAPASSLDCLLAKMPRATQRAIRVDRGTLDARADHFAWMRAPESIAGLLVDP